MYRDGKTEEWRQRLLKKMKRISLYNHIFWKRIAGTSFTNTNRTIYRPYYNGVKEELSDIKLFLRKYKGGSVDLEKRDNGICHVILNHPEKGNALSGKNSQLFFTGKYKVAAVSFEVCNIIPPKQPYI